jgi:hypothetical protein
MRCVVAGGPLPDMAWDPACGRTDGESDDLRARSLEDALA